MKGEINRDFYCSAGVFGKSAPEQRDDGIICHVYYCDKCKLCHRKWPTPERFKEEYGNEYPDYGAVYTLLSPNLIEEESWMIKSFYEAKIMKKQFDDIKSSYFKNYFIVCACTPWGKPPDDWQPKEEV